MRPTELPLLWRALRPFSFPLSALPVFVGTAATGPVRSWDLTLLAWSVWGVLCLHGFGNVVNDFFDHRHGVDHRRGEEGERPGRFLVEGRLLPRHMAFLAGFCLVALCPAAVWLLLRRGPRVLPFGMAALLLAWAYTGPPFRLKHRGLGVVAVFLAFGPLLVCGAAATALPPSSLRPADLLLPLLLSCLVGAQTTAVLVANDLRDADEDRGAGIRTLVQLLGLRGCRSLFVVLVLLPPLAVVAGVTLGRLPATCLLAALSLVGHLPLLSPLWRGRRLPDVDARVAKGSALFHGGLALGLALGIC